MYLLICNNMTMIEHLTKDSFKRKVFDYQNERMYRFEGERPVVIDFYTNWCVPCKTIALICSGSTRGKLIFTRWIATARRSW